MIKNDGSISVRIPADEVTWFSFLQSSRALNSEQGGWNFKKHWVEQGGMSLAQAGDFVKQLKKDKRYQRDVY